LHGGGGTLIVSLPLRANMTANPSNGMKLSEKIPPQKKTGATITDCTLYNPKKPNENFLNMTPKAIICCLK
jgi:hypothetical protein